MLNFLAPWALLLSAAAAVPLLLHLLRRRTGTKLDFPAVRYLLRAEREHAREVRLRNLALMLLRVGIVVAIALAMARPIGLLPGVGHPPTAVAIVLDNSLSTTAAGRDGPVLTRLADAAQALVAAAGASDELTLVTFDQVVTSGERDAVRSAIAAVRPIDGAGDAAGALARARAVLEASDLPERRLVVLTDAQRSEWDDVRLAPAMPTLLLAAANEVTRNRAVTEAVPEPAHWSPRGTLRALVTGDSAPWRLTLGGSTVARGTAAPREAVRARVQPIARGWLAGALELEPDEYRGDDHRWFAVHVGDAPAVTVDASVGAFVAPAFATLRESGRTRDGAEIAVASATAARLPGLLFAPADPLQVPAANRALERAGVPWRFDARRSGEAEARGDRLGDATVRLWYELVPTAPLSGVDTLARIGTRPWIVAGPRYVLVASPLLPEATDLPLQAEFVPWLDAVLAERLASAQGAAVPVRPGARVRVPSGVTALELHDGTLRAVVPSADIALPWTSGVHFWRRGETRAGALVVNPEVRESALERMPTDSLALQLGEAAVSATGPALAREMLAAGGRRQLDAPLLILALLLLVAESVVARRGQAIART